MDLPLWQLNLWVINISRNLHLIEFLFLYAESKTKVIEMEINYLISLKIFTTHFYSFHLNILQPNKGLLNLKASEEVEQIKAKDIYQSISKLSLSYLIFIALLFYQFKFLCSPSCSWTSIIYLTYISFKFFIY